MKKISIITIILFSALFGFINKVDAFYQSTMVQIYDPSNDAVIPEGQFYIEYLVPHVYMGVLDDKIMTVVEWYTTKDGVRIDGGRIQYADNLLVMYKHGDFYREKKPFNTVGGGEYTFNVYAVPINGDTLKRDDRIPSSSWPGKTVRFYVYEDKKADGVFAVDKITKKVGDKKFWNEFATTSNGEVTYSSSNTKVAKVDKNTGVVTIVGKGKANITATVSRTYIYQKFTKSYQVEIFAEDEKVETTTTKSSPDAETTTTTLPKPTTTTKRTTKPTTRVTTRSTTKKVTTTTKKTTKAKTSQTTKQTTAATTTAKSTNKTTTTKKQVVNIPTTKSTTTTTKKNSNVAPTVTAQKTTTTAARKNATLVFYNDSVYKSPGDTFTNSLKTKDTDGALTYSSSNTNVATVDSNGRVTVKGEGVTYISVKSAQTAKYNAGNAYYTLRVYQAQISVG